MNIDFSFLYNIFSPELATFVVAMLPVAELRVSIPLAIGVYNLSPFWAFVISVIGNMVPVFFILLLIGRVSNFLCKYFKFFDKFFNWLFERTRRKNSASFQKWGDFALYFFVAVPLPMTGGWSGALAAFIFGIPFARAFWLIFGGVFTAGVIVLLLSLGLFGFGT